MFFLKIFTRVSDGRKYPADIANSIHMSFSLDGSYFTPLNNNFGILFPKAEITEDNTIASRGVIAPRLGRIGNGYAIWGKYVDSNSEPVGGNQVWLWKTNDFLTFEEVGAVSGEYIANWEIIDGNIIELDDNLGNRIIDKWGFIKAERVCLPDNITVSGRKEASGIKAKIIYSDGSAAEKRVDWQTDSIPENNGKAVPGVFTVKGRIRKKSYPYPLTKGCFADPMIFKWESRMYLLGTNDNLDDVGLYIRCADTAEELFTEKAVERCILPYNAEKGHIQTFWAPEWHLIGGVPYILFAVGGRKWAPQSHMMRLKDGGNPMKADDWEEPVRVMKKDGTPLTTDGITLDMTHFESVGRDYLIWSYRYGIGTSLDTGSMLYIAETDAREPYRLISDPVLLSRPLYGWENTAGTINNEGPFPLLTEEKIYIAYSGGSANDYSYAVGYLIADRSANLLDVGSWEKYPCPLLCSYSVGIDGPGHNSFFIDEDGDTMIAYHGQIKPFRCAGVHRVHFNKNGFPLLNMSPDRDIPEAMTEVCAEMKVCD